MVGGPDRDGWDDNILDYERGEVSIEYNVAYVGALAARAHFALIE